MARNRTVDLTRTLAIVLMVLFHFIYDLKTFGYVGWDIPDGAGWRQFRWLILSLFFVCAGVGLVYAHGQGLRARKFFVRLGQIGAGALAVTALSLVMFPANWIFFGVLHFIALACLLSVPLIRRPRLAIAAALLLWGALGLGWLETNWPIYFLYRAWPESMPAYAADYVPLLPWLPVLWLGIAAGHAGWLARDPLKFTRLSDVAAWPGRHSLMIYLVHQPVMIGILMLVSGRF